MSGTRTWHVPPPLAGRPVKQQIAEGVHWLRNQPGTHIVLADAATSATDTKLIELTRAVNTLTPQEFIDRSFPVSAILLAWPSAEVAAAFSPQGPIVGSHTSVCVLEWGMPRWMSAWLRAHQASHAKHGVPFPGSSARMIPAHLEGILHAECGAIRDASHDASAHQAATALLVNVVRAGTSFDPVGLWAWALAAGYPPERARLLREAGEEALIAVGESTDAGWGVA